MVDTPQPRRRIAYYGGSFDPVHRGHLAIAEALRTQFALDEFVFIPAFHAPHKSRRTPTSAYDRYTMLCLATQQEEAVRVSRMEIEVPERPYTVETLATLVTRFANDEIFFVMGADSWQDITTWREWEKVLSLSNHIVVTRPGYEIGTHHVTDGIRSRIEDIRQSEHISPAGPDLKRIYITDRVKLDISATDIRHSIRAGDLSWREDVPAEVANYIEKYQIYN